MHGGVRLSQRAGWAEGQPISDLMSRALAAPDLISLAAGFVDQQTLPVEAAKEALDAIFAEPAAARAALQYGTTPGYPPLREALLARHLETDRRAAAESNLSVEQVVVTAGSNQLLHLVCESLMDPGDIAISAAPTYLVILGMLSNLGARTFGVAADEGGIIPESLDEALARLDRAGELGRVKLIYINSYYDNPSGATMPAQRRAAVVEIARRWSKVGRIHVVEDAAYRELRYSGEDIPSLRSFDEEGETVIVAGTFSKSFSPGIRVGWGILPHSLVEPVCNQKGNIDFGSPNFNQHLMAKVLELGVYDRHIERLRAGYRQKMQAMLDAAEEHLAPLDDVSWVTPTGGLYVWLKLPAGMDAGPGGKLFDLALEEGMFYVPGQFCYPQEGQPACRNMIRLSFGVQPCEKIKQGMQALARAIERARA